MAVPEENVTKQGSWYPGIGLRFGVVIGIMVLISVAATALWTHHRFSSALITEELEQLGGAAQAAALGLEAEAARTIARFLALTPPIRGIAKARASGGIDPRNGSTEAQWRQRLGIIFTEMLIITRHSNATAPGSGAEQVQPGDATPCAPLNWMQRLRRVFDIDLRFCPRCGAELHVLAVITNPQVIATILAHRAKHGSRDPPAALQPVVQPLPSRLLFSHGLGLHCDAATALVRSSFASDFSP